MAANNEKQKTKKEGQSALSPEGKAAKIKEHRDRFFSLSVDIEEAKNHLTDLNRSRSDVLKAVKKLAFSKDDEPTTEDIVAAMQSA